MMQHVAQQHGHLFTLVAAAGHIAGLLNTLCAAATGLPSSSDAL